MISQEYTSNGSSITDDQYHSTVRLVSPEDPAIILRTTVRKDWLRYPRKWIFFSTNRVVVCIKSMQCYRWYIVTLLFKGMECFSFLFQGSTGSSKAVLLSHKTLVNLGIFCVDRSMPDDEEHQEVFLMLCHIFQKHPIIYNTAHFSELAKK